MVDEEMSVPLLSLFISSHHLVIPAICCLCFSWDAILSRFLYVWPFSACFLLYCLFLFLYCFASASPRLFLKWFFFLFGLLFFDLFRRLIFFLKLFLFLGFPQFGHLFSILFFAASLSSSVILQPCRLFFSCIACSSRSIFCFSGD